VTVFSRNPQISDGLGSQQKQPSCRM
jgi:hypothetical protein